MVLKENRNSIYTIQDAHYSQALHISCLIVFFFFFNQDLQLQNSSHSLYFVLGVYELFPGMEPASSQLTVVTLSQKPVKSKQNAVSEMEIERLTKHFVLAAQDICSKLKLAGYWADFINPFSGLPYLSPFHNNNKLYVTDERFRCLGFKIFDKGQCRVISDKTIRNFVGEYIKIINIYLSTYTVERCV